MCPANSCLISIKGSQFITAKFRVSHSAGVSKSCLQSSAVGHHLHFLSVSNKSAQFTCQNDSSNPSAKRKCPGTHLGRTNHFVFGSVLITSCNKIPRTSCCSCQTCPHVPPFLWKDCSAGAQGTGRRSSRIGRGKFITPLLLQAEKMEVLSRAELILQSGGENTENHLYFFSSNNANITQVVTVCFQGRKGHSTQSPRWLSSLQQREQGLGLKLCSVWGRRGLSTDPCAGMEMWSRDRKSVV